MLNLLRPEQKKKIIREYHVRFFVVAFTMLFLAQVIALILLLPSYTTSQAKADDVGSQSSILQAQSVSQKVSELNALVKTTNDYVDVFLGAPTSTDVTSAITSVVADRGTNIKINGVMYTNQNGKPQVVVQGVAAVRQDLLDFIKRLKDQPGVSSVNLPLSDFSQAQNITFSLTITRSP